MVGEDEDKEEEGGDDVMKVDGETADKGKGKGKGHVEWEEE